MLQIYGIWSTEQGRGRKQWQSSSPASRVGEYLPFTDICCRASSKHCTDKLQVGLKLSWNYNWSPNYSDHFRWRKWQLWREDSYGVSQILHEIPLQAPTTTKSPGISQTTVGNPNLWAGKRTGDDNFVPCSEAFASKVQHNFGYKIHLKKMVAVFISVHIALIYFHFSVNFSGKCCHFCVFHPTWMIFAGNGNSPRRDPPTKFQRGKKKRISVS